MTVPAERRHVLVTGAAGGLGQAITAAFRAHGDLVTAVDARSDALAVYTPDDGVRRVVADLADPGVGRVVDDAWNAAGPVDVLVNAAGIWPATPLLEMQSAGWDHVLAVNTRAPLLLTIALARRVVETGRTASVVNVSSGAAIRARPGATHYSASKAALEAVTRGCGVELAGLGIRVNAVAPGFVTGSSQEVNPITEDYRAAASRNPMGRPGSPTDIAEAVLFLAGPSSSWTTGAVLRVDGGSSAGSADLPIHWDRTSDLQQPARVTPTDG